MIRRIMRFWTKEHSLSAILAILVVHVFIMAPTFGGGLFLRLAADLVLYLFLLAGLLTMSRKKSFRIAFSILIVLGMVVHMGRCLFGIRALVGWDFIFLSLSLAGMLVITLAMVYQEGPVTGHRLRGAVAAYLMFAAIFGKIYALIAYLAPGAFHVSPGLTGLSVEGTEDFFYFSVVALTTMGFGDITPVAPIARSFVMSEAFIGQLYPAILIARLVSLSIIVKEKQ